MIAPAVSYGNAEVRGRLRVWKKQLAQHYSQFNAGYESLCAGKLKSVPFDLARCTRSGRARALAAIRRAIGPGATLEEIYLNGRMALFSILKPRESVTCEVPYDASQSERKSLLQDCVAVDYFIIGRTPFNDDRIDLATGFWTLEVPDHALGRAVERSRFLHPGAIIREAHLNLLDLPNTALDLLAEKTAYIKAGPGCFIGALRVGKDVLIIDLDVRARVVTWLSEDQLHADQIPLHERGKPGERLGDGWLRPRPLREIIETASGDLACSAWRPPRSSSFVRRVK